MTMYPQLKLILLSIMCLVLFSLNGLAQGKIIEGQSLDSKILGRKVNYAVYLPADYERSKRYYPIVYLLHGYTDDETGWIQFGEIKRLADEAIRTGKIPPMILAMPDAGVTWYINDASGKVRYEDMFMEEFIPHVEKKYRIRAQRAYRALAGLSMGGYGSLIYAMKHPDKFVATAPLSAAIYTEDQVIGYKQERWDNVEAVMYGKGVSGKDRISEHWKSNNPLYMVKTLDIEKLKSVKYYFDIGDDDFLYKGNSEIHMLFRELNIKHEYRVRDGKHNWTYWRTGIIDALAFVGESFRR